MTTARPAAVAGSFYPASDDLLRAAVSDYLDRARVPVAGAPTVLPKALIVPHAGYRYSGTVAASAYLLLRPFAGKVRRVVLAGPAHRVHVDSLAFSPASEFETPLGAVPICLPGDQVLRMPGVSVSDLAHRDEHSLEVQLPFLQRVLGSFFAIPVLVGDADASLVAEVLEQLWGGEETVIVISSDLSHYMDDAKARETDRATCRAIEEMDDSRISAVQACGALPIKGLLRAARHHGLRAVTLMLGNSGDTSGDRDRVVGYGAWAFVAASRR